MQVGVSRTTITPDRPTWMTGFASRTAPSAGVYHDIEAAAIVLDNGAEKLAILAADLVGVDEFLLQPVREHAATLGIPPQSVLLNCSHTHCAPACRVIRGSCRNFDDEYLAALQGKLCRLLDDALADLQPGTLQYTSGFCTLGINRRKIGSDGSCTMRPNAEKPVDIDVPTLSVLTPRGDVRAIAFSYACHPTTMGGQLVGTDYPGPARDLVTEKLEGCIPIFWQGCGGDVKPRNLTGEGTFASGPVEMVYDIGRELGRAVLAGLCGQATELDDRLGTAGALVDLPTRDTPSEEELQTLEQGNQWERMWAEAARRTIAEQGALAGAIPVEVQVLCIGGLYIVGMGGEVSCEIGLEIKDRLNHLQVCTLGYSNLLRCYVASDRSHPEGGYEVRDSFLYSRTPEPRPLGLKPGAQKLLVDKTLELILAMEAAR